MTGRRRVRVGVVFGGRSGEHDVSLRSAQTVMSALEAAGHQVVPIGVTRQGAWLTSGDPMGELQAQSPLFALTDDGRSRGSVLDEVEELSLRARGSAEVAVIPAENWAGSFDVIFPVLHGPMGEDGAVQGLFELAGLPYVGAGVMASAVAMDKAISKQVLAHAGIPQTPWLAVLRKEWDRFPESVVADVERELGYPCFVKPANLGSSVGVTKAHSASELPAAMAEAGRHDRKIVIEKGVDARELEVSVLGNDEPTASTVGEVVPGHEFYDYEDKYVDDSSQLIIPAMIPDEVAEEVRGLAIRAFRTLDCAGMARVDFFLERQTNRVLLNEINTIPGFTAISMYPKLWEASGIPLPDLVERLIGLAIERHEELRGGG
ncbi:MAG TPA: D-alanine--D-alanine ligase family protein [Thermomicrobiales bacterium]|nr:D-alanine--D-alanine ligase family protein [Thermomicrobiales bacterium]HRA31115.1 D-alanine--D-alanine ligase family protein [Thermomicrobiales bacterium]